MKSWDFYCKRHILAWMHVVWAILCQNRLRGLTSRAVGEKTRKVTRGSHRNDVSPLTQGLRYRSLWCIMMALDTEIMYFFLIWTDDTNFRSNFICKLGKHADSVVYYALVCCIIQSNICTIDRVFGIKVRMSGLSINRYQPIVKRWLSAIALSVHL